MTLPRLPLAHQALAVPVGRKQMLGIHARDTPAAIPTGVDVVLQVAAHAGPSSCWVDAF
jgi:uncharacterized membrane-anchored protein